MTRIAATLVAAALLLQARGGLAQDATPVEYRVKAAYLFNFTKFVDWPPEAAGATALRLCIASRNPFGDVLQEIIRDERVNGRPLQALLVRQPTASCHVLFIPRGVPHLRFLQAAAGRPVLTVGETAGFLRDGGIVNFRVDEGKVRFEIAHEAALRSRLSISSRLLRLAADPMSQLPAPEQPRSTGI